MGNPQTGQRGFTLLELTVVLAIFGVMASVSVPIVNTYITPSKERAYVSEQDRIQAAVDAFYSNQENVRFLNKRQYPLIGSGQVNQASLDSNEATTRLLRDNGDPFAAPPPVATGAPLSAPLWNPLGGTQGANLSAVPVWSDNGDGVRTITPTSPDTWTTVDVQVNSGTCQVNSVTCQGDPRYYFIDFELLVKRGYLGAVSKSASPDNKPPGSSNTYAGSYSWYVDLKGRVQSIYFYFPDKVGFVDKVYP